MRTSALGFPVYPLSHCHGVSCTLCPLVSFNNFNFFFFLHKSIASIGERAAACYLHKSSGFRWNWVFLERHIIRYLPLLRPHYIFYESIMLQETLALKTHLSLSPYNCGRLSCLVRILVFTDLLNSLRFVFHITHCTVFH